LLERWSIRDKEKLELEEGVEAAGEGCGPVEGDGIEAGERRVWGDDIEGGEGIGGDDIAGGDDRADGGVLIAHAVLFVGDRERSG
jgi:hypothetical protein